MPKQIKPRIVADYKKILDSKGNTFTKSGITGIVKTLNELYETDPIVIKKYPWGYKERKRWLNKKNT